jgi:hypothetical protein
MKTCAIDTAADAVVLFDKGYSYFTFDNTSHDFKQCRQLSKAASLNLSYTIASDFYYNFRDWQIQRDIPVLYSEYYTAIPEFFKYQLRVTGYERVKLDKEETQKDENLMVQYQTLQQTGGNVERGSYSIHSSSASTIWKAQNIPAFKEEEYMTSKLNFITAIVYELLSVHFPNQSFHLYIDTWANIDQKLLDSQDFGKQLDPTGKVKDLTAEAIGDAQSVEDKMN